MQSLICHVQKSFTTLEEAAAKQQMPVGSVDEFPLKPSHVHSLSNTTPAASPAEAGKSETSPRCKQGTFPKAGAERGCLEKVQSEGGGKGTVGRRKETAVKETRKKKMQQDRRHIYIDTLHHSIHQGKWKQIQIPKRTKALRETWREKRPGIAAAPASCSGYSSPPGPL